jgi:P2-related tail formation protein
MRKLIADAQANAKRCKAELSAIRRDLTRMRKMVRMVERWKKDHRK